MIRQHFPAIRIGLCITFLTVTILLVSDQLFNIVPDQREQLAETRRLFCESVAVQVSFLIEKDDISTIRRTMNSLVERDSDVLSMGLRLENGELMTNTDRHLNVWDTANTTQSTLDQVRVPLYKQNKPWGTVEIKFNPQGTTLWNMVKNSPLTRLILATVVFGLLAYTFFIRRTLRIMDPGSVVPDRVKAALDQLVEGVALLDEHKTIVLANNALLTMTGMTLDKIVGQPLSNLDWKTNSTQNDVKDDLPWEQISSTNLKAQGDRLLLATKDKKNLILSCNVAAITDGDGNQRGMIASFDDISEIQKTNLKLKKTISQLEAAELKIRSQNDELRKMSSIDPLTGIMNRGAFFEKFHTEFMLAKQEGLILSCIMIDIDYFKNINDTYGHAVGDKVIKGMAQVLTEHCEKNGAVGRYGGEEFCLVLPGIDLNGAMHISDKIRESFSNWSEDETSPTSGKQITVSLGVSAIDLGAKDAEEMVDQADKALYQSKTSGRNRVSRWFENSQMSEAS
jgi:diguanylate cyclase (GGDEF)-like protein/PAS domain S-box-containing protein